MGRLMRVAKALWHELPVIVFATSFFAAFPVWLLSNQDGWTELDCGGAPWRCRVTRWGLFGDQVETHEVAQVTLGSKPLRAKGKTAQFGHQLELVTTTQQRVGVSPLSDRDEWTSLQAELEQARAAGASMQKRVPPHPMFWLVVGLVVLFAAVGAAMPVSVALSNGWKEPQGPRAGR